MSVVNDTVAGRRATPVDSVHARPIEVASMENAKQPDGGKVAAKARPTVEQSMKAFRALRKRRLETTATERVVDSMVSQSGEGSLIHAIEKAPSEPGDTA